jgi:xanthosine utilization system XapX-like protein
MLGRIGASIAGLVLMIYGLIAAFSPLPAGAPLVILGLLMIAGANPAARPVIVRLRRRWPWFNKLVRIVGKRAPRHIARVADETEPTASVQGPGGDRVE